MNPDLRIRAAVRENVLRDPGGVSEADRLRAVTEGGRGWVAGVDGEVAGSCIARLAVASVPSTRTTTTVESAPGAPT